MKIKIEYLKSHLFIVLVLFSLVSAGCSDKKNPTIQFENLQVILPPPVSSGTAAYGVILNKGKEPDTLKHISSNAGMVTLHQTSIKNGSAQMNHVKNYKITKDKSLILKPMSYHLMLMNIDHDVIKENGQVEFIFEFEKSGKIKVVAPIVKN